MSDAPGLEGFDEYFLASCSFDQRGLSRLLKQNDVFDDMVDTRRLKTGTVVLLCIKALCINIVVRCPARPTPIPRHEPGRIDPVSDRVMLLFDVPMVLAWPHFTAIAGPGYSSMYRHCGSFNLIDHVRAHSIEELRFNS